MSPTLYKFENAEEETGHKPNRLDGKIEYFMPHKFEVIMLSRAHDVACLNGEEVSLLSLG